MSTFAFIPGHNANIVAKCCSCFAHCLLLKHIDVVVVVTLLPCSSLLLLLILLLTIIIHSIIISFY